jgi:hypothetical protein
MYFFTNRSKEIFTIQEAVGQKGREKTEKNHICMISYSTNLL